MRKTVTTLCEVSYPNVFEVLMSYHKENASDLATLGGRMKAVRLAKGLTADALAEMLKISRPTLTSWEKDRTRKNPIPQHRLEDFCRATEVSLEWLVSLSGAAPNLPLDIPARAFVGKKPETIKQMFVLPPPPTAPTEVAQIKPPALSAHAHGEATEPEAKWAIPREVLTIGFSCEPNHAVIKRVRMPYTAPDGTKVARNDYVLIDASRTAINEPGIYYVLTKPDDTEAKRAHVSADETTGKLTIHLLGQAEPVSADDLGEVLGRAMGVFHPI
jgi:transcriptional regulator with XRE-family HTH domain